MADNLPSGRAKSCMYRKIPRRGASNLKNPHLLITLELNMETKTLIYCIVKFTPEIDKIRTHILMYTFPF